MAVRAASRSVDDLRDLATWLRRRPGVLDTAFAVVIALLSLPALGQVPEPEGVDLRDPSVVSLALILLSTLPLAWRRAHPYRVLVVVAVAAVAYEALQYSGTNLGGIGVLVALYTVASLCDRRRSLMAAAFVAVALGLVLASSAYDLTLAAVLSNYLLFAVAWIVGENQRTRRAHVTGLEERAALLERERELDTSAAVTAERARIARELHDVVAHSMSVMVVQAGAARRVVDGDPAAAKEAMASIEATGRQSLTEMRRLLGVLRKETGATGREPQPGLEHLDALVAQTRDAGVPVEVEVVGQPQSLPAGVDLSAYRIVQEALTNTLKHGGPGAIARVVLRYGEDDLRIEVSDDGRGDAPDAVGTGDGPRHGLLGMRERVAMFGGDLHVGNRRGGGFVVRARLPLGAARLGPEAAVR